LLRPNPPRVITVALAVALTIVGVALVFFQSEAIDFVQTLPLSRDLSRQVLDLMGRQVVAWAALAASPILLIVGSLLPGI
jgi:hypothetical protein